MLKKILSISGKPGLYKLISQGKNMLIVESLADGRRQPAHSTEKVISLGDVAIFTEDGEMPLHAVFTAIKEKENAQKIALDPKSSSAVLRDFFAEILPDFDREKVYPTDIKKVIQWYNLLIDGNITEFTPEEDKEQKEEAVAQEEE